MGFKDMKRDDHGHVIGKDETDGQKCQHQSGGSGNKFQDSYKELDNEGLRYNVEGGHYEFNTQEDAKKAYKMLMNKYGNENVTINGFDVDVSLPDDSFDDDYEEEFKEDRDEKVSMDIGEYFTDKQLSDVKRYCDKYEVDFEKAKDRLAEVYNKGISENMSPVDAADIAYEAVTDDIVEGTFDMVSNKKESRKPKFDIDELNRRTMRSAQMSQMVENAKKNGQTPQQVLDSVAYDMDISPDSEEYKNLKDIVMRDTRLNKESGAYEYNKYTTGSNKLLSGDERKKMEALAEEFKKAGLDVQVKDTYEDYGANMKITNLISGDTQVLDPAEWMDYMNGNKSAEEIVKSVKEGEYSDVFDWREPQQELGEEDIYNKFIDEGDKSYSEHKGNPNWDRAYYRYHHGSSSQMPENYKAGQDFSEDDVVKLSNGEYGKVAQIMPNGDLYVISRSGGKVYKSNEITKEGLLGDYLNSFHGK